MSTPGIINYPTSLDDAVSLIEQVNNARSTLTSAISDTDLVIPLTSASVFTDTGFATLIDSTDPDVPPTKIEIVLYTSKVGNNIIIPTGGRGQQGTTAQSFSSGHYLEQRPTIACLSVLKSALVAIETKLGFGSATAAANTLLRGIATGTSDFGTLTDAYVDAAAAIGLSKLAALTASRAIISNGSGVLSVSAVTVAELGYVSGATSGIQAQLNGKAATSHTHSAADITSGTLAIARGGTGTGTAPGDGKLLIGKTDGSYAVVNLTQGANITITNSDGGITIASAVGAHNLLSSTHSDTTPASVARGDLITGQGGSAAWTRLPKGINATYLRSDGTDISWSNVLAADVSGTISDGSLSSNVFYVDGSRVGASSGTTGNAFSFDGLSLTSGSLFKARVHASGFTGSLIKLTDDAGSPVTLFEVGPTGAITTGSIPYASVTSKSVVNADVSNSAAIAYSKLNLSTSIVNADISASAAIAYSKLALSGSIVNTDINGSAGIAYSKLNLTGTVVNADVSSSAAIAYSKLALSGSVLNADISASAAIAYSKLSLAASIVNADVSPSAAIAYSKLALTGSVINADISSSAAIAYSKLNLSTSILNADINASAAIAYSKLNLSGSVVNADVATGAAIAWNKLDKTGSSLADIITRSAGDLSSGTLSDARLSSNVFYVDGTRAGNSSATTGDAFSLDGLSLTSGNLIKGRIPSSGFTGSLIQITDNAGSPVTLFAIGPTGAITTGSIAYSAITSKSVVNADVSGSAAIAYSKLNLGTSIVNSDISASAAIAYSKLSLTGAILNADINASAAIAWSKIDKAGSSLSDFTTRSAGDLSSGTLSDSRLSSNVFYVDGTRTGASSATTGTAFGFDGLSITSGILLKGRVHASGFTGSLLKITDDAGSPVTLFEIGSAGAITTGTIPYSAVTSKSVVNADVNASAAIAYSKLNLATSIVNADVSGSAAIAYSKLNLSTSIVNGDISASAAIAYSKLATLTASRALASDGSGVIVVTSVTDTELGYVSGVTSAIQTQLNAKGGSFTTSAALAALLSDETGSGAAVFGTAPTIAGGSVTALTTFGIRSSGTGAFDLQLANTENLTANRILTLTVNDAARTISLSGNLTVSSAATISGTNTGDQTITLTGNVTGSGTGSFAATIANNVVTNAMLATMATATFKGRTTAGTGNAEDLTATQATALLNAMVGDSGSGGTKGLVPVPATGDATKFLRGDATWATVSASPGGSTTQLQYNSSGSFAGISGATSDGTSVTFGSSNLLATSPKITTGILDANANTWLTQTATASAIFGLNLANAASGGTVALSSTTPTAAASTIAGTPLSFTASNAVAGTTNAGAAAGGAMTFAAGNAARLTSGNANGGDINFTPGTGIGTGTTGNAVITAGRICIGGTTSSFPSLSRNGAQFRMLLADASGVASLLTGVLNVQSGSSASGLFVAPDGANNATLQVDTSAGSAATGVKIVAAAAGSGVTMTAISSGTNENILLSAKGTGNVRLGTAPTTNDTAAGTMISGASASVKPLVVQRFSGQTANLMEIQLNTGVIKWSIDSGGDTMSSFCSTTSIQAYKVQVVGDTYARWYVQGGGDMRLGAGSTDVDVGINRHAANVMRINNGNGNSLQGALMVAQYQETQTGSLTILPSLSNTSTIADIARFGITSTGTPAAGLGGQNSFSIHSSTTKDQTAAIEKWYWMTATHASRSAAWELNTVSNATTSNRFLVVPRKSLTDASAANLFEIALASGATTGGFIRATIHCTDGTDYQTRTAMVRYNGANKGGVYSSDITIVSEGFSGSTGTLAGTWTINTGTNKITIQLNADSSLTPTSLYVLYDIANTSEAVITLL